jgi:restriction endonuclease S subunit
MYGKENPRIHPLDLSNIKIPSPNLDIQKQIIFDIQKQERINDEAKQKLNKYRKQIDDLIFEYLTDRG